MKTVCQKKKLDSSLYVVTLVTDSNHGQLLPCKPTTTVGDLKTYEINLIPRDSVRLRKQSMPDGRRVAGKSQIDGGKQGEEDQEEDVSNHIYVYSYETHCDVIKYIHYLIEPTCPVITAGVTS